MLSERKERPPMITPRHRHHVCGDVNHFCPIDDSKTTPLPSALMQCKERFSRENFISVLWWRAGLRAAVSS